MRRVFNWDGRKGGAGMEDLPSLISSAIEATLNNTEAMRVYAAEKADKLGRIFSSVYYVFPSHCALEASVGFTKICSQETKYIASFYGP